MVAPGVHALMLLTPVPSRKSLVPTIVTLTSLLIVIINGRITDHILFSVMFTVRL